MWKLADFGLTSEGTSDGAVRTEYARGTPGYRAPELLVEDGSDFTNKVDIWSLGCVLYELVVGRRVFISDRDVRAHYRAGTLLEIPCRDTFNERAKNKFCDAIHEMMKKERESRPAASTLHSLFRQYELAAEVRTLPDDLQHPDPTISPIPRLRCPPNQNLNVNLETERHRWLALKTRFHSNVISPSGNRVGLFKEYEYWVFDTSNNQANGPIPLRPPMKFGGHFKKKGVYHYGLSMGEPKHHKYKITKFLCAALTDKYVAIGTQDKILIFGNGGQWLVAHEEKDASIDQLMFSPDGTELLAIVTTMVKDISHQRLLLAPTTSFPGTTLRREKPVLTEVVDWGKRVQIPSGAAFSSDGNRIAIYTSCDAEGKCEIRLLERQCIRDNKFEWQRLGEDSIDVGSRRSPGELTGVQLFVRFVL